ncbi:MAG: type II methionyl aminopeptidase [Candidatus Woesearchaeota archaeon]|nr:MAG: type II methionyl aminopeptidase [Candidatus Woesearchaeota archaeon]
MDKETEEKWIGAGKIGSNALLQGAKLIKAGVSLLEVAEKIESIIIKAGAKPAFPCNISINDLAAHFTPNLNDKQVFNENDVVKLDVGAQIDGCICDNAITVDLSGKNNDLVKASRDAVENAVKIVKPGLEIREIGKVIEEAIKSYGFNPITNLCGHGIEEYTQHAGLMIPNYDNKSTIKLKEGQVIAIEPFATSGEGHVTEGAPSNIYRLVNLKPVRDKNAREVLGFIAENYKTLPFAKRWVIKELGAKANFGFLFLEKQGNLSSYPQLPERSKKLVSQAEHTVIVKKKSIVTSAWTD